MRIWKRLLGTALCLCAAVCVMSVSASAAEHSHPICGKTHTEIGDHMGTCDNVTWKVWTGTSEISYDSNNTACVYLGDNATPSSAIQVTEGKTLNLCLNGKKLSRNSTVIEVKDGATLNICDCQGGGIITPIQSTYAAIEVTPSANSTATLNLYGGEVSGRVYDSILDESIIKLGSSSGGSKAVFNMYGGKVQNSTSYNSCSAVHVTHRSVCKINIYGGEVTCDEGDGIKAWNSGDAPVLIAGGTVSGGNAALSVLGNLTLSGSPTIRHIGESGVDIDITTSGTTTQNNYIAVTGDFAPAEGTKISVDVPNNQLKTGRIIAKPAAGASSLSGKAQYFVSAEEGYFVESNSNGDLQLTACAITGQPTVENSYTVTANGSDDKVKYQWYSAKSGDVPVTENSVKGKGDLFYWNDKWSCSPGEVTGFTLTMKKDAVLALLFPVDEGIPDYVTINSASIFDATGNHTVHKNSSDFETVAENEWPWTTYKKCTFIAPADGDYTLKINCSGDEYAALQFTATVTADMLDKELPGQTAATLNTSQLKPGSYICKVTWENKTTLNSQAVRYGTASSHVHSWSSEWTSDTTHHWHNCENANCPVTENSGKSGYAEHSGGTATCIAKAECVTCGTAYGALDANNHIGVLGVWQSNEDKHWKEYSCCQVHANEGNHQWDEGRETKSPTCTEDGVKTFTCSQCNNTKTEPISALGHDFENGTWQSDGDHHWKKCSRCDVTDTKTAHQWDDGKITTAATCTAAGEKTYTCTVCSATRTETVSATGHSWSDAWMHDAIHHWHDCENANCPVTENSGKSGYAEHSGGAANCTQQAVCTICGTAYGALDANGHDWGEWLVTNPATTSAAGEETRTCKRDASHTEKRDIPKLTPAPSGGGSSSGSGGTPAVTVPVSGSSDTVHVSASVSGSTAEVKEVKKTELDKIGTDSAVVIDLSGLNKGVTGVTLSTDTIDSICKTEADGVTIKLPSAELRVDRQTLAAVTEQAAGSKLRLVVEPDSTARSTMTAAQRSTLAGMKNAAALEAYFVSNGTRIHDFKGGSVELSIPYRAEGAIRAWFLKEDGTREPVSARYDKENAQLILHHFSHYVIEELDSSAAYTVCAKDDSCPLGAFGDLTAAAWYHDGVHYCLENGLMQGVSGGKFLPDGSTTRAQLVTILWRLEGSPETTGAVRFGDTAGGAWYTEAVRWAVGCGVVKGYDNGCFGPNDAVTREQMAAILYRYAQHKGYDVSAGEDTSILSFDDALTVSGYSIPAMQWACGSGMVRGIAQKGGMLLAPRDTTTRAQTATLLMRFQSAFAKEP